jgi:GNAT superfamily N-acetyltransferase
MTPDFLIGYEYDEFQRYYRTLDTLHNYYKSLELDDVIFGEIGPTLDTIIKQNQSHLIIWRVDEEIIGHAVWHETSTDEHRAGDSRDEIDCDIVRELFGGIKNNIVELHELWLRPVNRGKGYGQEFFEFFEQYIREQGFLGILYYTENPSAIHICRKRDYKEAFLTNSQWHIFSLNFEP